MGIAPFDSPTLGAFGIGVHCEETGIERLFSNALDEIVEGDGARSRHLTHAPYSPWRQAPWPSLTRPLR
jgi:hypothetical protein